MISTHRYDTLEQCPLLRALYDVEGLNINDKRNDLSFASIVGDWKDYVRESYGNGETALSNN